MHVSPLIFEKGEKVKLKLGWNVISNDWQPGKNKNKATKQKIVAENNKMTWNKNKSTQTHFLESVEIIYLSKK